jgi:anti-sigma factor RsiW
MNCERVEQLLSEHLEGFVSEREAGAMAAHLGRCPACRRRQEEFTTIRSSLRTLAQQLPLPESDIDRRAIDCWLAERAVSNAGWRR